VIACGLAVVYAFASTSSLFGVSGALAGVVCGLLVWLCFLVTATSIEVIWMGRSAKLWLFEAACSFVVMAVMAAIIAVW
jgi:ABC-type lipoprotein release transport system permease subunit